MEDGVRYWYFDGRRFVVQAPTTHLCMCSHTMMPRHFWRHQNTPHATQETTMNLSWIWGGLRGARDDLWETAAFVKQQFPCYFYYPHGIHKIERGNNFRGNVLQQAVIDAGLCHYDLCSPLRIDPSILQPKPPSAFPLPTIFSSSFSSLF